MTPIYSPKYTVSNCWFSQWLVGTSLFSFRHISPCPPPALCRFGSRAVPFGVPFLDARRVFECGAYFLQMCTRSNKSEVTRLRRAISLRSTM